MFFALHILSTVHRVNECMVDTVSYILGTLIRKKIKFFIIYKEIQNGAVAKSYMTNGLLIYGEIFPHFLIY